MERTGKHFFFENNAWDRAGKPTLVPIVEMQTSGVTGKKETSCQFYWNACKSQVTNLPSLEYLHGENNTCHDSFASFWWQSNDKYMQLDFAN